MFRKPLVRIRGIGGDGGVEQVKLSSMSHHIVPRARPVHRQRRYCVRRRRRRRSRWLCTLRWFFIACKPSSYTPIRMVGVVVGVGCTSGERRNKRYYRRAPASPPSLCLAAAAAGVALTAIHDGGRASFVFTIHAAQGCAEAFKRRPALLALACNPRLRPRRWDRALGKMSASTLKPTGYSGTHHQGTSGGAALAPWASFAALLCPSSSAVLWSPFPKRKPVSRHLMQHVTVCFILSFFSRTQMPSISVLLSQNPRRRLVTLTLGHRRGRSARRWIAAALILSSFRLLSLHVSALLCVPVFFNIPFFLSSSSALVTYLLPRPALVVQHDERV
ncbi:hypothetical protein C8J57DRAFT_1527861 [Mycena rebaudengoi]|nr:hypothetical protein C8J57DRAFT_1527861 [Mycena rebaudengoi]